MKLFIMLFIVVTGLSAETLVSAESYRTFNPEGSFQTQTVWAQKNLRGRIGMFGWGQYAVGYRQTYGGPYLQLTNWLQAGVGGGVEHTNNKTRGRLGSFVYATKGRTNLLAIYENFASGYWYLAISSISVSDRVIIGSWHQAFFGHGPRVQIKLGTIGNWTTSLRPAAGWDRNSGPTPNVILGLQFTYFKE